MYCATSDESGNLNKKDVPEAEAKVCLVLQSVHAVESASIILESHNSSLVEAIERKNQGISRLCKLYDEI